MFVSLYGGSLLWPLQGLCYTEKECYFKEFKCYKIWIGKNKIRQYIFE